MMPKETLQIAYDKLLLENLKLKKRIKELESGIEDVCDLINKKTTVSKWKISNQLDRTLKGL